MTVAEARRAKHLALANSQRVEAAKVKAAIVALPSQAGRRAAADHLFEPSPVVARMQLGALLTAIGRVSERAAERTLREVGFLPLLLHRRIGPLYEHGTAELTARQRQVLAAKLIDRLEEREGG